jgi:PRTRC genetic system protein E
MEAANEEANKAKKAIEDGPRAATEESNDLKGEVVDKQTIEVEMPGNEMTAGDTGGFFSILAALGFQQLNLSITKLDNGKLTLIVKPENFSDDPALDEISPLSLTATSEEFDKGFFEAVAKPLKEVAGVMSNAEHFLKDLKAKEKKTKAAEKKQKEIEKLVDKAKKHHEGDNFDLNSDSSLKTATKNWNAVIELDPDNEDAKKGLEKVQEQLKESESKLNL